VIDPDPDFVQAQAEFEKMKSNQRKKPIKKISA
jgi:hypothetical protein